MIIIHEEITTRTVLIFVSVTLKSIANRLTYLDAEFHKNTQSVTTTLFFES